MSVYLGIYAIAALLAFLVRDRGHSRALAIGFGLFLVAFAGMRVDVGCDYPAYLERYEYMYSKLDWISAFTMGEGGFNWLNMSMIDLGLSFNALLMACAVIFIACLVRFADIAKQPLALVVLSFPVLVVQLGMSGLRQALAVGFLMLAFASFVKGQRAVVAVWILVAAQFHTSAIIFLPIAALAGRQVSASRLIGVMVLLSPFVGWLLGDRLSVYNDRYVDQIYGETSSDGAWFRYALVLIPFFIFEWKRRLVAERHPRVFPLLRLFSLMSFSLFPVGLYSSVALHRLVFYVMPVSILALLSVADSVFDRGSERVGVAVPFIIYGTYITAWFILSSHGTSCYIPYQSWLT